MKNDVTIDFSVDSARTKFHPVAGILLDPLESEVLETIYSLRDLPKRGPGPFVPMPGSAPGPLCPCLDLPLPSGRKGSGRSRLLVGTTSATKLSLKVE